MSGQAFGGGVFIADTSARARAGHPAIREEWTGGAGYHRVKLPDALIAAPGSL